MKTTLLFVLLSFISCLNLLISICAYNTLGFFISAGCALIFFPLALYFVNKTEWKH